MRSATDFLPLIITWFINFARVTLPNLGSGSVSRLATTRLLGILNSLSSGISQDNPINPIVYSLLGLTRLNRKLKQPNLAAENLRLLLLRTFRTVFGATLSTLGNTGSIQ